MARIIGGIAASHTPTIGFALDKNKQDDPVWAPIFASFQPVRDWLDSRRPDVLLFVYNDHITSFFFDHYSAFTLGVGERWRWPTKAVARAICRRWPATRPWPATWAMR
jgi:gallate dioxygenase